MRRLRAAIRRWLGLGAVAAPRAPSEVRAAARLAELEARLAVLESDAELCGVVTGDVYCMLTRGQLRQVLARKNGGCGLGKEKCADWARRS